MVKLKDFMIVILVITFLTISTNTFAYIPTANVDHFDGSYSLPDSYWEKEKGKDNSYILKKGTNLKETRQWKELMGRNFRAGFKDILEKESKMQNSFGYPSIDNATDYYRRQCTSFAKMMLQSNDSTENWYKGPNVMKEANLYYDNSYKHRNKMVAYFSNNAYRYSDHPKSPDFHHVGFFIKYEYGNINSNGEKEVIGFWIVDQNYGWPAEQNGNPTGDGLIRKRLVKSSGTNSRNAVNYYFVDIR